MPSSSPESVSYVIEYLRKHRPELQSVLDVGFGFGKFGYLIRDYFEAKSKLLFQPEQWKLKIVGVDIFDGYLSEIQRIIYSQIIIGDIFNVLPKLGKFEVAILSDVIEHFSKDKGKILIDELFKHVEDIVISTPLGFLKKESASVALNSHEDHISGWTPEDFNNYYVLESVVIPRIYKPQSVIVMYIQKKKR
jgi:hypothetical protein